MRPVPIVVGLVLAQDSPQMALIPDEGMVQELASASPDPAFHDRVHAGRLDTAEDDPDAGVGEDGVEGAGEVRSAVADHELDPMRLLAEVHHQVAGLLHGPVPGWMRRDSEDSDTPGRVLYYGQGVGLGPVEQVDSEEITGQDRLDLGAQEL
jgi:hypothetical protein